MESLWPTTERESIFYPDYRIPIYHTPSLADLNSPFPTLGKASFHLRQHRYTFQLLLMIKLMFLIKLLLLPLNPLEQDILMLTFSQLHLYTRKLMNFLHRLNCKL